LFQGIIEYNFETIYPMGDSGQVWLKLTQWFQRKFKCMTDAMFWQIKAHMAFDQVNYKSGT
jgi:hypothetical protein